MADLEDQELEEAKDYGEVPEDAEDLDQEEGPAPQAAASVVPSAAPGVKQVAPSPMAKSQPVVPQKNPDQNKNDDLYNFLKNKFDPTSDQYKADLETDKQKREQLYNEIKGLQGRADQQSAIGRFFGSPGLMRQADEMRSIAARLPQQQLEDYNKGQELQKKDLFELMKDLREQDYRQQMLANQDRHQTQQEKFQNQELALKGQALGKEKAAPPLSPRLGAKVADLQAAENTVMRLRDLYNDSIAKNAGSSITQFIPGTSASEYADKKAPAEKLIRDAFGGNDKNLIDGDLLPSAATPREKANEKFAGLLNMIADRKKAYNQTFGEQGLGYNLGGLGAPSAPAAIAEQKPVSSGLIPSANAAPKTPSAPTPEDLKAINWALKNPTDPRAKKIMEIHKAEGIQ